MICELERPMSFFWRLIYFEHNSYRWPETFRKDVQRHCPKQTSLWETTLCQGVLCLSLPGLCYAHSCRNWETPQQPGFQREHSNTLWKSSLSNIEIPKMIGYFHMVITVFESCDQNQEKSNENFIFITSLAIVFSFLSRRLLDMAQMKLWRGLDTNSVKFCHVDHEEAVIFFLTRISIFPLSDYLFLYKFQRPQNLTYVKWAKNICVHIASLTK